MTIKNFICRAILCCLILGFTSKLRAAIIAQTLTEQPSIRLLEYQNEFQSGFGSAGDYFQVFDTVDKLSLPTNLVDTSDDGSLDALGLRLVDDSPVFGVSDTVNRDNPTLWAVATWQFDVSGYSVSDIMVDFAAMGDFESSDQFAFEYQLDSGAFQSVFAIMADTSEAHEYQMLDGRSVLLNDPLTIDGQVLSNQFTSFTSSRIAEVGEHLTVRLQAKADAGTEVFALKNILISGQQLAPTAHNVNAPNNVFMACVVASLLVFHRQRYRPKVAKKRLRLTY